MPTTRTPIWEQSEETRLAAAERRVSDEWLVVRVTGGRLPARMASRKVPLRPAKKSADAGGTSRPADRSAR